MRRHNNIAGAALLTLAFANPAPAQDFFATVATDEPTTGVDADSPWQSKAWVQQSAGYG